MNVQTLLDAAKERQQIRTDKDLAAALGVTKQAVSNWRQGVSLPDPVACATLAGLTGEPLARVLGVVGEARALSREEKAVWRKLAATAALAILCVLPAQQSNAATTTYDRATSADYILCSLQRCLDRLAAWLWRMVEGFPERSAIHA